MQRYAVRGSRPCSCCRGQLVRRVPSASIPHARGDAAHALTGPPGRYTGDIARRQCWPRHRKGCARYSTPSSPRQFGLDLGMIRWSRSSSARLTSSRLWDVLRAVQSKPSTWDRSSFAAVAFATISAHRPRRGSSMLPGARSRPRIKATRSLRRLPTLLPVGGGRTMLAKATVRMPRPPRWPG